MEVLVAVEQVEMMELLTQVVAVVVHQVAAVVEQLVVQVLL
jgi:hypothetical protein